MIKKIVVLSNFHWWLSGQNMFIKNGSNLRITYMLRKLGYEVLPIHHCATFTPEELIHIIENFAQNEQIAICLSTSFLSPEVNPHETRTGYLWGESVLKLLLKLSIFVQHNNHKLVIGGWQLSKKSFENSQWRKGWAIDVLSKIVTCFSLGDNIDIVDKICKDKPFNYETIGNSTIAYSTPITDFPDQASTPLPNDNIMQNETLVTEIGAGCVFSCSFCGYSLLGKRRTDYMRSYESLKHEIVTNYNNFGTRVYMLTDNIMNDYDEKLKHLIRIRDETGIDLRWFGYVRLDTIKTKEQAKLLADSGIAGSSFGIESFKPEVGKYIGKITDKNKLIDQLTLFRDAVGDNCFAVAGFIAGLPTETKDDLNNTLAWLLSDQGKYLLDGYRFEALMVHDDIDNKNAINKARNHPFRDYNIISRSEWTSPWGTRKEFSELAKIFNSKRPNMLGSGYIGGILHNMGMSAGYEIEDIIKSIRTGIGPNYTQFLNNTDLIEQYKQKLLKGIL